MATKEVKIKDKTFVTSIPEETILKRVREVAESISSDYADKNPLFLAVLNGSFVFASDLLRGMTVPCEISFVKLASYQGTMSTGHVKEVLGINEDLAGRHIIIVEDIVETGTTMKRMIESLGTRNPASVEICTLLFKPERLKEELDIRYVAFEIPNDFIIGYGFEATVKKIKKTESGVTLIPSNPAFDPIFYANDEIKELPVQVIGKVVELRAKYERDQIGHAKEDTNGIPIQKIY